MRVVDSLHRRHNSNLLPPIDSETASEESSDSFGVSNRLALTEPLDASSLFFNDTHPTQSILPRESWGAAPVESISLFPLLVRVT